MKVRVNMNELRGNNAFANYSLQGFSETGYIVANQQCVFRLHHDQNVAQGTVELGEINISTLFGMSEINDIQISPFEVNPSLYLTEVTFKLSLKSRLGNILEVRVSQLTPMIRDLHPLVNQGGSFQVPYKGYDLIITPILPTSFKYGLIIDGTLAKFQKFPYQELQIVEDGKMEVENLFQSYQSLSNLKVGGHKKQLGRIDRSVFATRMLNKDIMRMLGIKHIKGMLLHGPPGTGKTLIARQISSILKVKPKIVNGPQILNEFVGKSEEKIRELFEDARRDQEENGAKSELHCIIFDEIDAICRKRGSTVSNGVYDLVVNQLLTCIDGINALNNILVIGITNRKDLIDEAILRPGRLQVHIEINIPDEEGRLEVLNIHTENLRENKCLDDDVNLKEISRITKNYSGAELEAVVKSAQSFVLERLKSNPQELKANGVIRFSQQDFLRGVAETVPLFGVDNTLMETIIPKFLIEVPQYVDTYKSISRTIQNIGAGKHPILIKGQSGVGKTVLASLCARNSDYSFIKVINTDRFLGLNEGQVMAEIVRVFEGAEKCEKSFIVLDDLMRLINFVPLGQKYSSDILNLLINQVKKSLQPSKKQIILATVGLEKEFKELGLSKLFKYSFTMDKLRGTDLLEMMQTLGFNEYSSQSICESIQSGTIRRLIDTTQIQGTTNPQSWLNCWHQDDEC